MGGILNGDAIGEAIPIPIRGGFCQKVSNHVHWTMGGSPLAASSMENQFATSYFDSYGLTGGLPPSPDST